jgi:hypothetical protein
MSASVKNGPPDRKMRLPLIPNSEHRQAVSSARKATADLRGLGVQTRCAGYSGAACFQTKALRVDQSRSLMTQTAAAQQSWPA